MSEHIYGEIVVESHEYGASTGGEIPSPIRGEDLQDTRLPDEAPGETMSCHYMPYCDLECTGEITKECAEHMDGIVTVFLAVRRRDIGMLERSWGVAKKVVECGECRMSDESKPLPRS